MQWLYLFLGTILAVISMYHLFTHKKRKAAINDYIVYELKEKGKISTDSKVYRISVFCAYIVILLAVLLYIEIFRSFTAATIVFVLIFLLGVFVLLVLDRLFELRGDALIFAGYHAKWGIIRHVKWGKQRGKRRALIMELDKGTKIRTSIANEEAEELEEVLSNYVHFEKE
ncbi:hypothetical protein SAMN05421736_105135 [Evansella caseinilytica]|uniref:DUF5673 domain-containing protein n=1 Tax=Evansella caseinilytica TaxID=1503961 RepID=A0A1H3PNZ9_9BACI|nr:hypothetical protein [Evansella caseinilytica]SDZ02758.1 hypothetical protein SAMN05421736_105135 [Evansella caseinilytica]